MTYFRAGGHYHRPQELNDRVRNGNECDPLSKVTGKDIRRRIRPPGAKFQTMVAVLWHLFALG